VGVSAGEPWATNFLTNRTTAQFVDPWTLRERVLQSGSAGPPIPASAIQAGIDRLQAERPDGPEFPITLMSVLCDWLNACGPNSPRLRDLEALLREIESHLHAGRLNSSAPDARLIAGSCGVLADVARVLLGDRFRGAYRKLGIRGAQTILTLRELTRDPATWEQFWNELAAGFPDRNRRRSQSSEDNDPVPEDEESIRARNARGRYQSNPNPDEY
jgi:hypothetical protein